MAQAFALCHANAFSVFDKRNYRGHFPLVLRVRTRYGRESEPLTY